MAVQTYADRRERFGTVVSESRHFEESGMTDVAAVAGDLEKRLEQHRRELTAYCYRMLGSAFEAEDAVQETLVRAWRAFDRFEGRSSLRSWLYSIATNVCLDLLNGKKRRALPMDLSSAVPGDGVPGPVLGEQTWIQPIPDGRVVQGGDDPAELAVERETIRLAFVRALQLLPPRQRAVLILREVLRWQATEVAELLDTTVVSVNSALQRARATLATSNVGAPDAFQPMDTEQQQLLARYVDAFERFDVDSLVSLLHEDAVMSMPPYDMWLLGPAALGNWLHGGGSGCRGSRFRAIEANGFPAFAQWRRSESGSGYDAFSIHVLEVTQGKISELHFFVEPALFPLFGLPGHLDEE
jgi:RNA polymerase sigma-70 factor (ECF subfamily)